MLLMTTTAMMMMISHAIFFYREEKNLRSTNTTTTSSCAARPSHHPRGSHDEATGWCSNADEGLGGKGGGSVCEGKRKTTDTKKNQQMSICEALHMQEEEQHRVGRKMCLENANESSQTLPALPGSP
ncbi:neuraminidase [Anopheles sinensis]|uniref:Neuraminidase n=1 Tax=Anopheles sinensis TaxID=74873 RepID=A0A084VKT4_ANOSI|nr:neuraminidase [Anopheles sinensis]